MQVTTEQLWGDVRRTPSGCWERPGRTTGYGAMWLDGKMVTTHRLAWKTFWGRAIPDGLFVCHHCDNKLCCRPSHLFLGTNADNMADCRRKGRTRKGARHPSVGHPEMFHRGADHYAAVLTEENVREIRRLRATGLGPRPIAAITGLHQSSVANIIYRGSWRHVKDAP